MRKHLPMMLVLLAGILTHVLFWGYPEQTVFDEVHFGKFVSGYFTHEYFFDIHPPLGKLLISGAGAMAGFQPGFSFGQIGDSFPDNTYIALRLLPMIAGSLLPVVIFLLALELGYSKAAATTAGLLIVLENALLVQSRLILLDPFLLVFGFGAWLAYARYRNYHNRWLLLTAAVFAGLSMSVKWTGITFLGLIGIFEFVGFLRQRSWRRFFSLLMLLAVPLVLYYSIFVIHLSLLSKTGPGDAFMSQEFRKTLKGSEDSKNPTLVPANMFQKVLQLNKEMYLANARLTAGHPYSSKWYTWPFMLRPIYYWNHASARMYLLGNPVVWWASTVGIFYALITAIASLMPIPGMAPMPRNIKRFLLLISFAYLINMLPFIGISRAMFLYHYFTGLIIAILALVYLIDQLQNKNKLFTGLVALSLIAFVFFAPLTYGTSMSDKAFKARIWIHSWE